MPMRKRTILMHPEIDAKINELAKEHHGGDYDAMLNRILDWFMMSRDLTAFDESEKP